MFASFAQSARSSYSASHFIRRSFLLLLTITLLPGTLAAQTAQTAQQAAAERLATAAAQLFDEGTKESLEQALSKFLEAAPLFHAAGDTVNEATMCNNIGVVYSKLGETRKALDYLNQALPLYRAVGNRADEATALKLVGALYIELGEPQQALDYFNQALPLFRAVGDRTGEAATLHNIGVVYARLGEKQKALEYYNQVLPFFRAAGNRKGEATILNNVGQVYAALGEQQKALDAYNQSLSLSRAAGDRTGEATTLNNIGLVYHARGEQRQALDYFNQVLTFCRAAGDRRGLATALNNIGLVYSALGEQQKALDYHTQALPLRRAVSDRNGEATTLNNIGEIYADLGEQQKALDYLNQALPLYRAAGDRAGEATALNNIGGRYYALGEQQQALNYFNQALPLRRAVGDRSGEATTLDSVGKVYAALGEQQKALDAYNQALPLRRAVGDRRGEAATLSNLGFVYAALGERQKALEYNNQALSLYRAAEDRSGEAAALNNIGEVYNELGEKRKALDYFNQALPLRRVVGDRTGEANTLNNIGAVSAALGERQQALDTYNQALPLLRAVGDRTGEATTLNNIGEVYRQSGEQQQALDYYSQALPLLRAVGDRRSQASTLSNVALVERTRGNFTAALANIEAAITILESLRTKIGSQELRSSFFATVQGYYEFYIDLLMRLHRQQPTAGYDGKALQASERGRARSLLEMLAEANADIRQGVDATLLARERTLQQQLNARAQQQAQLPNGPRTQAQASAIAKEIDALTTEFQQVEAQIRQTSPRYAALTQPQPLSLSELQAQVLDADTLLLEYSLGAERSYLWAVTPTSIASYELPKRAEIEAAARAFYDFSRAAPRPATKLDLDDEAQQARAQAAQMAAQLSRSLLAPAAPLLGKKRLLIVADGALQYIPFAALPAPTGGASNTAATPLVVEHEIVSLPSASTLAVLRREAGERKSAPKLLAVLADPVFERTDERLKSSAGQPMTNGASLAAPAAGTHGLSLGVARAAQESGVATADLQIPRLRATRREADELGKLVPPGMRRAALDFAASRAAATDLNLGDYRFVHFATHGFLDSQHPELSGIVLSMFDEGGMPQDGFLRAHEVFNLKLNADVVTLSACQTGLGKEIKGEGLVGLTRGFMYAGAARVVVSLWSVNDAATAELMTRFYRGMLVHNLRPAQALQAAQVSMLNDKRFAAPFYWAAFTLQGEWR